MDYIADETNPFESSMTGKYLTFLIGNETYGLEIKYVTEIICIPAFTEMPEMPQYVKGVINLRGKIIPLMDVRLRFGIDPKPYDERTCVIVSILNGLSVGLIVDSVNEVQKLSDEDISPLQRLDEYSSFIKSLGKPEGCIILLLDCEKLLVSDRVNRLSNIQ